MLSHDHRHQRLGHAVKAAAFYDLDGTLMGLNLIHGTIFAFSYIGAWSGRVTSVLGLATRLPMLFLAERHDRHLLNLVLFEMFKGIPRARLMTLGEEYCDRVLIANMYPSAIEMIATNRDAGLEPVLVTGSPDFIVEPLARRLGIETFVANRLAFNDGFATGRLCEPVIVGDAKAAWCTQFAEANRISLNDSWGYADSHYDLPFLAALGHPVAVNPNRRLLAVARQRRWPIVRFDKTAEFHRPLGIGPDAPDARHPIDERPQPKAHGTAQRRA
jgi:HAD superfamily hydrolase (TIGR01490 family)